MLPLILAVAGGATALYYKKYGALPFTSGSNAPAKAVLPPAAAVKLASDLTKPVAERPHVDTTVAKPKLAVTNKVASPHATPGAPTVLTVTKVIVPKQTVTLGGGEVKTGQAVTDAMKAKQIALKKGDKGASVIRLQLSMGEPTTGVFDAHLETMVKELQKAHSLKVDGIVGPKTWAIFK